MHGQFVRSLMLSTVFCSVAGLAHAQTAGQTGLTPSGEATVAKDAGQSPGNTVARAGRQDDVKLDTIIVTASTRKQTQMTSSNSVTDLSSTQVQNLAPQSQAEVLRLIPGMIVDDTAGPGGNSNISVRGLPITTGGSPFVQIQEDGLPGVLFGDMNFGNNDYWTHYDEGNKVEAVRGGNASTLASQAPGAVINYISDTGQKFGGFLDLTEGLGFNESQVDGSLGGPIIEGPNGLDAHVEGYFRDGSGQRDLKYTSEFGGQVKANATKYFADGDGFFRLTFKHLDDSEPTYTSAPLVATTSGNAITGVSAFPGFDARTQSSLSSLDRNWEYVNPAGQLATAHNDGIHPVATAIGGELNYKISDLVTFDDKFRKTWMSGDFATQFLDIATTESITGTGPTRSHFVYANGPQAGQIYNAAYVNDGPNIYTRMNNMGNLVNDMSVGGKLPFGPDNAVSVHLGYFFMEQTIAQTWAVNSDYSALTGSNPAQLDLVTNTGKYLTVMGQSGYGQGFSPTCCAREYNLTVDDNAPYVDLGYDWNGLHLDGSMRYDSVHVSGFATGGTPATTITTTTTQLYHGQLVSLPTVIPNLKNVEQDDYTVSYFSWSIGAIYDITKNLAVFARGSEGERVNVDRNILSGYMNPDGSLNAAGQAAATDTVDQQEVGVKASGEDPLGGHYGLDVTGYHATLTISNYDLTTNEFFNDSYRSFGVETEASYRYENFNVRANVTYDNSIYTANKEDPTAIGNAVANTPDWVWSVAPNYSWGPVNGGFVFQGQSGSWVNSDHTLYIPSQWFWDAYLRYTPIPHFQLRLNANNLLNSFGLSARSDLSSAAAVRALGAAGGFTGLTTVRPSPGRAITFTATYVF